MASWVEDLRDRLWANISQAGHLGDEAKLALLYSELGKAVKVEKLTKEKEKLEEELAEANEEIKKLRLQLGRHR